LKGTFKHRFTKAGTYKYVCTIHTRLGMHGTIVVS
ncbi:MAG: Copper binding protein plastocyanin/azurin family, partial [Solirubrobacteraceae bacterium]|nr:Copper binding protein plastocyanin/azurin family [Solirubrobacteraceae bacterium]